MVASPLHPRQHAYQEGKSTKTALAEVVTEIEKGMTYRRLALAVLLDIDGAFNYMTVDSICLGASEHAVPDTFGSWMQRLLSSRVIEAHWKNHMLRTWVSSGYPQSPTMWCLVVNQLLRELSKFGIFARVYADDI